MFKILIIFLSILINDSVIASSTADVGSVSGNLTEGATLMAKLLWAACIIVGIFLLMISFTQFQTHRSNPKLVPLATPITYFLLSICVFSIPFLHRIMGVNEENTLEQTARHTDLDSAAYDDYD